MTRTLVTGGIRSGKSRLAEQLLADADGVCYIAPGYPADPAVDAEWAERVRQHQARRPAHWQTAETADVADVVRAADRPVLVDCLGAWLTRQLDDVGAWAEPRAVWSPRLEERIDELVTAWADCHQRAVAVTNEVGWTLVPENPAGRIFVDQLGRLNARIGAVSDEVILVVAGRSLRL